MTGVIGCGCTWKCVQNRPGALPAGVLPSGCTVRMSSTYGRLQNRLHFVIVIMLICDKG